jgi:hypothetical protein
MYNDKMMFGAYYKDKHLHAPLLVSQWRSQGESVGEQLTFPFWASKVTKIYISNSRK